jgi:hypothetical protein
MVVPMIGDLNISSWDEKVNGGLWGSAFGRWVGVRERERQNI